MSLREHNEEHHLESTSSLPIPNNVTLGEECDDEYIWTNLLGNKSKDSSSSSSSWDDLCNGLKNLDRSLRCGICLNICHAPVSIVGCNHTYCSECIRVHFQTELQMMTRAKKVATCPDCRNEVDTSGRIPYSKCLVPNRLAENVCTQFQQIRPLLYKILNKTKYRSSRTSSNKSSDQNNSESGTRSDNNSRTIESTTTTVTNDDKVRREPLRPVIYTAHKRKALQEMCEKVGLATHGSDKELRQRHEAFINLYNADCDSSNPRSARSIANEINERETARMYNQIDSRTSKCIENLKVSRAQIEVSADPGVVINNDKATLTSGSKTFDNKLNNNYKQLIQQVKNQKLKEKEKLSRTMLDDTNERQNEDKKKKVEENEAELDTNAIRVLNIREIDKSNKVVIATSDSNDKSLCRDTKPIAFTPVVVQGNVGTATGSIDGDLRHNNQENRQRTIDQSATARPIAAKTQNLLSPPCIKKSTTVSASVIANLSKTDILQRSSSISHDNAISSRKRSSCDIVEIVDDIDHQLSYGDNNKKTRFLKLMEQMRNDANSSSNGIHLSKQDTKRRRQIDCVPSLIGPWNCTRCTFRNERNVSSIAVCAMCEEPRPSPRKTSIAEDVL